MIHCSRPRTAGQLTWQNNKSWHGRVLAVLTTLAALGLSQVDVGSRTPVVYVVTVILLGAVALGAPIYTVMGGMAMLLLYGRLRRGARKRRNYGRGQRAGGTP